MHRPGAATGRAPRAAGRAGARTRDPSTAQRQDGSGRSPGPGGAGSPDGSSVFLEQVECAASPSAILRAGVDVQFSVLRANRGYIQYSSDRQADTAHAIAGGRVEDETFRWFALEHPCQLQAIDGPARKG